MNTAVVSRGIVSMNKLHPAVKTVWRTESGVYWVAWVLGLFLFEDVAVMGQDIMWIRTPMLVIASLGILSAVFCPSWHYRLWRYELRDEELRLVRGIWRRVDTRVPLCSIQHVDVRQNPFESFPDLARLIIYTEAMRSRKHSVPGRLEQCWRILGPSPTGTRRDFLILPGLSYGDAIRLREMIRQYVRVPNA